MKSITYLLAATVASSLSAQAVTLTASWAGQSQLATTVGTQSQMQTLGAGPISGISTRSQQLNIAAGQARSEVRWHVSQPIFDDKIEFLYDVYGSVSSSLPATASVDQHDVIVTLQAATPRQIMLSMDIASEVTPNAPAPRMDVDIDNDGSVDFSTTNTTGTQSLTVGPVPLAIRITAAGLASTPGILEASFLSKLHMRIEPDNNISKHLIAAGCANILVANSAFSHSGIRMEVPYTHGQDLVVLGLDTQPIALPGTLRQLPCLLLPRPDLVALVPTNGSFDLPIPASARPIRIFAQAVELVAIDEIWSTNAYLFVAN